MKIRSLLLLLIISGFTAQAYNPYRLYLLSRLNTTQHFSPSNNLNDKKPDFYTLSPIPRYERPKGSVFCRMEDEMIKATKVWLTVGVK